MTSYDSKDIKLLTDIEHVRLRTQMYLGNLNRVQYDIPQFNLTDNKLEISTHEFVPAVLKAVNEILDNANDELVQLKKKTKTITIDGCPSEGRFTISDNGRGIPIDKHESGKYTPEVALASLRAGRNFGETQAGVIGVNGVGSACSNYCSSYFDITIHRDKKTYKQTFSNGASVVTKPKITKGPTTKTGTTIDFQLDSTVFKNGIDIPDSLMRSRAMELAFNNPGMTVKYCGESFNFKHGLTDIVKSISSNYFEFTQDGIKFFVIFDHNDNIDERIFTWVNSSLLYDGGICNTQFMNALCDKTISHLASRAKKLKCEVTKNDVRQQLLILATVVIERPEYDSQSKTRLAGPTMKKTFVELIDNKWKSFTRTNKDWLETVLERAAKRHQSHETKQAIKEASKARKKKVPGLIDATSKYRSNCKLTITEGLSASYMISDVRDPTTLASFPLTGKINNVYGCKPGELLKMPKIMNLIQAIGLIPGQQAVRKDLNFGEVWVSTDADPDGDDICSLLINVFFQFWPELFDPLYPPYFKRLVAPNVVVYKGDKRIHFTNRAAYEKQKNKYKSWTVEYYKGLGSMIIDDWRQILNDTKYQLPIVDTDGTLKDTLQLLFDKKLVEQRREWLAN